MKFKITAALAATFIAVLLAFPAEARSSCDGIHRCRCGSTQTAHFGLPRVFNGHNLWQAIEWPRAFPHTDLHAGAVMYQHGGGPTGHVSRIVEVRGRCLALVSDDKGQYERNTCIRGATFVEVTISTRHHNRHSNVRHVAVNYSMLTTSKDVP